MQCSSFNPFRTWRCKSRIEAREELRLIPLPSTVEKKRKEPHLTTCHPLLERKEEKGAVSFIPFVFLNGGQTKKRDFKDSKH
jgi:hypothetical protein